MARLDLPHFLLDFFEVFGSKRNRAVEIVVEAVLDRGSDAEFGLGIQLEHRRPAAARFATSGRRIACHTELHGIIEVRSDMAVTSQAGVDESVLVSQAREGDTEAFGALVRRYEGKIFRLAQHVTQNREDAEDVLQETFMKAYEHLDQFKGDSKFYTWIVRIAVNQALMKLRRRRTDKSVSLDETIDTGEDTVVREIAAWD